jgi:Sugar (and other) transporter
VIGPALGWRLAFLADPALAAVIIYVRRALPESPRWLLTHGQTAEAEQTLTRIEAQVQHDLGRPLPPTDDSQAIEIRPVRRTGYLTLLGLLFTSYRRRAVLGATLMITQSFLYNAIFFTYTLVLTKFYHVSATFAPVYLIAFAVGNLAGPLSIGAVRHHRPQDHDLRDLHRLRRDARGLRVAVRPARAERHDADHRLVRHLLRRLGRGQRRLPDRQRDLPAGGPRRGDRRVLRHRPVLRRHRPILYGALIGAGHDPFRLFTGYLIGGGVMIIGGVVELLIGVPAQQQPLEAIARPLSAVAPLHKAAYSPGMLPSGTGTSAAA